MRRVARLLVLAFALLVGLASPVESRPHHHRSLRPRSTHHRYHGASVRIHHGHRPPAWWRPYVVPPDVIRVHDGDTFYAGRVTIRLHGIDTPELGEPKAADATRRLAELLHTGPVTIVPRAEDVYGRLVADVFVRGENVADVLRREGFEKPRLRL